MNRRLKKHNNFAFRLLNLFIIVIILLYYNQLISIQTELSKANVIIEKVEAIQEQTQLDGTDTLVQEVSQQKKYQDGLYEGLGEGFGGPISLTVKIENGSISKIEVISAENEDVAYFDMAVQLFEIIRSSQNTEVDVISGATFSSNGILAAVDQALEKAVNK